MKKHNQLVNKFPLWAILGSSLILRILFSTRGTLELDFNTFISWSVNLAENGFSNFYSGWSDYLPGYLYVLWFLGKIRGVVPDVILYKLPAILADLGTGYLIFKIVENLKGKKLGVIAAATYLFNPAIWANSTLWGQADSLTALFALLSVFLFDKNLHLSAFSLAIGTAIKPQAAFAAIAILYLMKKRKWKIKKILLYITFSLVAFLAFFLPFSKGNFFEFLVQRLSVSFNQYPYMSVNAFNFWGIFGFWKSDYSVPQIVGLVGALVFALASGIKLMKKPTGHYLFISIVFASTFLLLTRIHERHLLPTFAPLTIAAIIEPLLFLPLVGFSITYLLNLYYSFNWVTYDFKTVFSPEVTSFLSILNLAFLGYMAAVTFKPNFVKNVFVKISGYFSKRQKKEIKLPKLKLSKKGARIMLALVVLFSLSTRLVKLSNPTEMYFDEVYHAFTAKLVLHGDPKAWEWWNEHPEGFAYEWTHPPLAKLGMALGMKIFGENSFGWRIPAALLGAGTVYLVYVLGKTIFKDELVGILSAAIFSLDGLSLTMSRIGMNDTYLLFFVLLSVYLFLRQKDFWSAISFGLAIASKWSAVWAIPILFIIWIHRRHKFKLGILWFLVLPVGIYLLSYFQMFMTGHDLNTFWGMQKQMWWYHTGLTESHAYGSSWISWPFMVRPVYLYTSDEIGGMVSRIYAIGNPLVFWFGLSSIFLSFIYSLKEHNKRLGLIVFSYLIFFVPWAASPRIMFLYHYLPALPFLALAAGYVLRRNLKLALPFLASSLLLFIYFYPHWVGLSVPLWIDSSYYWFTPWR
ncbi:glycosyltransferase family 39 protein [Candidatus Woesebacteria bacterium]|nr:glycosyltransferase family 39 protein [Candidatus Woesebacteria bacterium]